MHRSRIASGLFALTLLLAVAGCRQVAVTSDPSLAYAIEVYNPMSHPMIVSYEDSGGAHSLGTVAARATERFVVAGAAAPNVIIVARDQGNTHTVRKNVTLQAGSTVQVTLSN